MKIGDFIKREKKKTSVYLWNHFNSKLNIKLLESVFLFFEKRNRL